MGPSCRARAWSDTPEEWEQFVKNHPPLRAAVNRLMRKAMDLYGTMKGLLDRVERLEIRVRALEDSQISPEELEEAARMAESVSDDPDYEPSITPTVEGDEL